MRINRSSLGAALFTASILDAALVWLPAGSPLSAVTFVLGFFGLAVSMLTTPGGVHGNIEGRLWTVGLIANTVVFYFVIQGVSWVFQSRMKARSR